MSGVTALQFVARRGLAIYTTLSFFFSNETRLTPLVPCDMHGMIFDRKCKTAERSLVRFRTSSNFRPRLSPAFVSLRTAAERLLPENNLSRKTPRLHFFRFCFAPPLLLYSIFSLPLSLSLCLSHFSFSSLSFF